VKVFAYSCIQEIIFKSSPSSLRTQRKASQPSALRSEGSRSTASQLEPSPSPPKLCSKINGIMDTFGDWKDRPEPLLGNASPAQSTLSLDSTVNLYQPGPSAPRALTSKNLHPPVPLYYDYTEDFDIEEEYYSQDGDNRPLPPFLIDRTIRGDRKSRPECSLTDSLVARPPGISMNFQSQDAQSSQDTTQWKSAAASELTIPSINPASRARDALNIPPHHESRNSLSSESETAAGASTQGVDSLTLSTKNKLMDEPSTKSSDLDIKPHPLLIQVPKPFGSQENYGQEDTMEIDRRSNRNSSYGLLAYLPVFPNPPDRPVRVRTDTVPAVRSHRGFVTDSDLTKLDLENPAEDIREDRKPLVQLSRRYSLAAPPHGERDIRKRIPQRSASARDERTRSSRVYSVDCGLVGLAQLITRIEKVNESVPDDLPSLTTGVSIQPLLALPRHGILRDPLMLHSEQVHRQTPSLESRISLNKFRSEGDLRRAIRYQYPILAEGLPFSCNDIRLKRYEAPSFSHRIPRKSLPRSASPILAPEPISPARMLKLKNSIPHLMKALPPIPLGSMGEAHQGSVLGPGSNTESIPTSAEPNSTPICIDSVEAVLLADDASIISHKPLKLKLKSRSSLSQRTRSLSNTHQWSLGESHLWIDQYSNVQLPTTRPEKHVGRTMARVKLRTTKASSSTEGTVRINKDARSYKVVNNLDFRHPRDLFTPPGFSGMFRQVGRHFGSRKTSHSDEPPIPPENSNTLDPTMMECHQGSNLDPLLDLGLPQRLAATACPISPTEVQSFFSDDSSQVRGHNSLRQRISNLRARIPVPYTSRPVVQSCDDVAWKERSGGTTPVVKWSKPYLDANKDQSIIPETGVRPHRLRLKFSDWFKGARSAVAGCVRQRDSDELK
jgi:hypothetical protein